MGVSESCGVAGDEVVVIGFESAGGVGVFGDGAGADLRGFGGGVVEGEDFDGVFAVSEVEGVDVDGEAVVGGAELGDGGGVGEGRVGGVGGGLHDAVDGDFDGGGVGAQVGVKGPAGDGLVLLRG